ncbi:MAG: hypothetical protein ACFFBP_12310 [Promethearchaeota archaeon]
MFIVVCAFVADFDIIFLKFTKEDNHRMFFSHSIFPSLILFVSGILFNSYFLNICGVACLSHVFIDTIDWGTNVFFFKRKIIGFKFLITKEEFDNIESYLVKYKVARSFFDFRYYQSKLMMTLEIGFFLAMMVFMISFSLVFILMIMLYFIGFVLHLFTHYRLKAIEET